MEFDESKKLDVEISHNEFVENRVGKNTELRRAFWMLWTLR